MIDFNDLNKNQIEAVKYDDGPLLIIAGAGSGKTRVITYKISYLIDKGIDHRSILGMTFTNKAANEMKERVKNILDDNSKNVFISTFHKFCGRVLRQFIDKIGYNLNFTIYDTLDQKKLISDIKKENKFDFLKEKSVLSKISYYKNHNLLPDDLVKDVYSETDKQVVDCYAIYLQKMYKLNALDFDDMLLLTVKLLKEQPDVKNYLNNIFKYILVDEYQDTNIVQFELIKLLSSNGQHLTVVGDDDQSIYKFRGANISNILDFENVFKNTKVIKLTQNYRSTNNILNLANSVIDKNVNRMGKNLWSDNGDGNMPIWTEYTSEADEADKTIYNIYKLNDFKNTAILYRRNAQSRSLEECCIKYSVPYTIIGGIEFYERKEVKDILAYLKIASNEYDELSLFRVLNIPRRGIGESSVDKLIKYSNDNNISIYESLKQIDKIDITKKAKSGIKDFINVIENIKNKTEIEHMIDAILDVGKYKEYLIDEYGQVEAEDRLDNIKEIKNKSTSFKIMYYKQNQDDILNNYKQNISGIELLTEFLNELSLVTNTDNLDNDSEKLTLMTIHASKGLEYDNIYIVGLNEGNLPSQLSIDEGDVEEERRLFYVGITRAKKNLFLSSSSFGFLNGRNVPFIKSRFVDEMDDKYVTKYPNENKISTNIFFDDYNNYKINSKYSKPNLFSSKNKIIKTNISDDIYNSNFDTKKININTKDLYTTGKQMIKPDKLDYDVGDTVEHVKYGLGKVTKIDEQQTDFEVTVLFDNNVEKSFYSLFAKLKKI